MQAVRRESKALLFVERLANLFQKYIQWSVLLRELAEVKNQGRSWETMVENECWHQASIPFGTNRIITKQWLAQENKTTVECFTR